MSVTRFKGRLFSLTVGVNDELLEAMRRFPDLAAKALQEGADYWHTGILPEHFKKPAHDRYGYAQRSRTYLKSKHGKPDLINNGSLRRDLKAQATFRVAGGAGAGRIAVELRMWARVLNFVPNMAQDSQELYVNHKPGKRGRMKRGYPNLKREIKAVTDDDREAVAKVIANALERMFGDTQGRESDD